MRHFHNHVGMQEWGIWDLEIRWYPPQQGLCLKKERRTTTLGMESWVIQTNTWFYQGSD